MNIIERPWEAGFIFEDCESVYIPPESTRLLFNLWYKHERTEDLNYHPNQKTKGFGIYLVRYTEEPKKRLLIFFNLSQDIIVLSMTLSGFSTYFYYVSQKTPSHQDIRPTFRTDYGNPSIYYRRYYNSRRYTVGELIKGRDIYG